MTNSKYFFAGSIFLTLVSMTLGVCLAVTVPTTRPLTGEYWGGNTGTGTIKGDCPDPTPKCETINCVRCADCHPASHELPDWGCEGTYLAQWDEKYIAGPNDEKGRYHFNGETDIFDCATLFLCKDCEADPAGGPAQKCKRIGGELDQVRYQRAEFAVDRRELVPEQKETGLEKKNVD